MLRRQYKAQSVLEYIETYGWTLIVVGIIIFALFELGVFAGNNFAVRDQPGSCAIVSVGSAGTRGMSLQGACDNGIPKSVASLNPLIGSSFISGYASDAFPTGNQGVSVFAWVDTISEATGTVFYFGGILPGSGLALRVDGRTGSGVLTVSNLGGNFSSTIGGLDDGNWHFVGVVHPGGTNQYDLFIDGQWTNGTLSTPTNITRANNFVIGKDSVLVVSPFEFVGQISNVQLYNTSLSQSQVEGLWLEGIGGAPEDINNVAGWWPLNDNSNDYSGNGQNAGAYNVTFITDWTSGYNQPNP